MIVRIELDYRAGDVLAKAAADLTVYRRLKEIFPRAPEEAERERSYSWERDTLIDILQDGPYLAELGVAYEIKKFKGTLPLEAILPSDSDDPTRPTVVQKMKVYVQVPHIGLLAIDEVKVVTDYCTDMLQNELDRGWRILCVCPPNAARRPDYILGRTKEKE
jgi:hypothetical protein